MSEKSKKTENPKKSEKPKSEKSDKSGKEGEGSEKPKKKKIKSTRYPSPWWDGMLSIPLKSTKPDYSNVPDIRTWNMSPFPPERFDLDEMQQLEKLGYRGASRLEALKKSRMPASKDDRPSFGPCATCGSKCGKNCPRESSLAWSPPRCPPRYIYQPYGPSPIPISPISTSYSKSYMNYTPYGAPSYPAVRTSLYTSEKLPPRQYPEYITLNRCPYIMAEQVYVPFGPTPEMKMHPFEYKPYGPSVLPLTFAHL